MKKLNYKGFSIVELLLILLVVAALIGVGYFVYQRNNKSSSATNEANTQTQSQIETSKTEESTVSEKTYSNRGISFVYPADWNLDDSGSFPVLQSPNYKKEGTQRMVIKSGEFIDVSQTTVTQPQITADNYINQADLYDTGSASNGKVVTINGNKAFQFDKGDPNGFDSSTTVFFRSNGTRVEVRVAYPHSSAKADHTQTYTALVNSIKF